MSNTSKAYMSEPTPAAWVVNTPGFWAAVDQPSDYVQREDAKDALAEAARILADVEQPACLPGFGSVGPNGLGPLGLKGMTALIPAGAIPYHDRPAFAALVASLAAFVADGRGASVSGPDVAKPFSPTLLTRKVARSGRDGSGSLRVDSHMASERTGYEHPAGVTVDVTCQTGVFVSLCVLLSPEGARALAAQLVEHADWSEVHILERKAQATADGGSL